MVVLDCEVAGFLKFHMLEQSFALLSKITFEHCTRAIKNSPVHARGSNQQQQALKIWREKRIKNFQGVSECWFCFSVYFVCQLSFLIWTASSVSGGLPHWQFRFFPPTALALRAIARCFQMSLPTGQWPRYATAPGSRLVHWLGVAGRFAKVWFSSCCNTTKDNDLKQPKVLSQMRVFHGAF